MAHLEGGFYAIHCTVKLSGAIHLVFGFWWMFHKMSISVDGDIDGCSPQLHCKIGIYACGYYVNDSTGFQTRIWGNWVCWTEVNKTVFRRWTSPVEGKKVKKSGPNVGWTYRNMLIANDFIDSGFLSFFFFWCNPLDIWLVYLFIISLNLCFEKWEIYWIQKQYLPYQV